MTEQQTPRMADVFEDKVPEDPASSPVFKAWFKSSQVVDDQGRPLVVHHATTSEIQAFRQYTDVGHHFGTEQAAKDRMSFWAGDPKKAGKPTRTYQVYLSIQRPLEMEDRGVWEPGEMVPDLVQKNVLSQKESDEVLMRAQKQDKVETLRKILKAKGFDGIRYKNTVEDPGSSSWIAFDPWQVKSVENRGTWDRKRASIYE